MHPDKTIEDAVILLADSSAFVRRLTRMMLNHFGVRTVHEVGDGAAALDAIHSLSPDMMIMDWDLKVLSGPEVMRVVRCPDTFAKPMLPVIMLTEQGSRSRVAAGVRLGVHEILVKPVSPRVLRDRVLSVLLIPRPMVRSGNLYVPMPHRRADVDRIGVLHALLRPAGHPRSEITAQGSDAPSEPSPASSRAK